MCYISAASWPLHSQMKLFVFLLDKQKYYSVQTGSLQLFMTFPHAKSVLFQFDLSYTDLMEGHMNDNITYSTYQDFQYRLALALR